MNRLRAFLHLRRLAPLSAHQLIGQLQEGLGKAGVPSQPPVQGDWGWWLELSGYPTQLALCIYCEESDSGDVAVTLNLSRERMWSWKQLKMLDTGSMANEVYDVLERVLAAESAVQVIGWVEEFPF